MQSSNSNIHKKERVTSTYAEIYLDDDYCDFEKSDYEKLENVIQTDNDDTWISPSDLLIGVIELKPPFTSKITRGKTHEGILTIGDNIFKRKRAAFLQHLTELINDNDSGWIHILDAEKKLVEAKVRNIYHNIFLEKSKIMSKEMSNFFEKSLKKLEDNVKSEIEIILVSVHAGIISDLNFEIRQKLIKERTILENILKDRYESEVNKIQIYYKILLDNELQRQNTLTNNALFERNDALLSFYRQIEAENLTGTMYVMCAERKKCKIKQFLLENYQTTDLSEKIKKIKEQESVLEAFRNRDMKISLINNAWENKIRNVLQLFLKFISFSLKLIPEQSTFLLDLEKMVVLQINEFQKKPQNVSTILIDENDVNNIFQFEEPRVEEKTCDNEPFVIVGDLNDPTPPKYGSSETLATDVDLPYFRVQRQFVYAKCHKYEQIKAFLESQRCKCHDVQTMPQQSESGELSDSPPAKTHSTPPESISSEEPLLINDIQRLQDCPARNCQDWAKSYTFPYLDSYLDFSEENFERVKTILGGSTTIEPPPKLIDPMKLVKAELPFSATKELYHTVETQYSSQEDLNITNITCSCVSGRLHKTSSSRDNVKVNKSEDLQELLSKRKQSIIDVIQNNPKLLKMFTDECFDFVF
ncbi:unnamed protein product [Diatraea saccharalis]|uniref:Uncharacterized protein n=1 Tax=Diatraea saccharalis TaxID=40085 RepID=A0A9N9R8X3_9NEOP|nr:unnamed protein product [Diatraea saccharalis]